MDKSLEKNVKIKNIIIVLLFILLAVSIGYICYDKLYEKKEPKIIKKKVITVQESIENNDTNMKIDENRTIQTLMLDDGIGFIIVDKKGGVYFYISENITGTHFDRDSEKVKQAVVNLQKQYQDYDIDGYQQMAKNNGETRLFKGIKLPISDVVAAYELVSGQSYQGWSIYFIKSDGTISRFSLGKTIYENNGDILLTNNVDELINITSLAQSISSSGYSEAREIIAIEKDGSEHIIHE